LKPARFVNSALLISRYSTSAHFSICLDLSAARCYLKLTRKPQTPAELTTLTEDIEKTLRRFSPSGRFWRC